MHDQIWAGNHSLGSFLPAIFQMLLPPALATQELSGERPVVQTCPEPGASTPGGGDGGGGRISCPLPRRLSPSGCPVSHQMVLILQEVEQGANLSLIFEARPLI